MITSPRFDKTHEYLTGLPQPPFLSPSWSLSLRADRRTMGNVSIFLHFHVGSAWVGAIAFLSPWPPAFSVCAKVTANGTPSPWHLSKLAWFF
ncbi:MAG: hypothetical protein IPH82_23600 [Chloroflexi bacterium]|nr:hypothetical protein [Chloroflexota bacterium]